jgi:hypothetical protein
MQRGTLEMEITLVLYFPEYLASTKKIKYFHLQLVHPTYWKNPSTTPFFEKYLLN